MYRAGTGELRTYYEGLLVKRQQTESQLMDMERPRHLSTKHLRETLRSIDAEIAKTRRKLERLES